MKKYLHIAAKIIFSLILLLPILGATGVFPDATRNLYNTDRAFAFIQMLTDTGYITYMMAVVHILALIALWTRREALAALLELPIMLNVVAFHLVLDGGLLTAGASLADLMLLLNLYFLWVNREKYAVLLRPATM
ncbi:MAG: hypothetical protein JWM46_332 [Candidatus Kaiserbacteria bacterium]|nr:hypothetical protein [Candidatus Kaiserbacteria bacterium]